MRHLWVLLGLVIGACTSGGEDSGDGGNLISSGGHRATGGASPPTSGGTFMSGGTLSGGKNLGGFAGVTFGGTNPAGSAGATSGGTFATGGIPNVSGGTTSGGTTPLGGSAGTGAKAGAGSTDPLDGLQSVEVNPPSAKLLAGDSNSSQSFTLNGHFKDGSTRDITPLAWWTITQPDLLTLSGSTVTALGKRGGIATVIAGLSSFSNSAEVRVNWQKTVLQPGAPAGSGPRLTGTETPALVPQLVYPLAGALFPTNLPAIEVQWKPASGTNLFDVAIVGPQLDLHVITPCNAIAGGCALTLDTDTWATVTTTLSGADPANITVRAAGSTAGQVGTSPPATLQFTNDAIRGGLYYFNTKDSGTTHPGIQRYDFATNKVEAFFTSGVCAGCHAISKDGTKMLASICTSARGCARPLQLAVMDVATKAVVSPPMPVGDSDTQTWSPDNNFYVTAPTCNTIHSSSPFACNGFNGGKMTLVDAASNTAVGPVPAGTGALYPSFSNRGDALVYTRGSYREPLSIRNSSLYLLDFTPGAANKWGTERALLTASSSNYENNYHPSFSLDDQWVLFSRSNCFPGVDDPNATNINTNKCDTYNDTTARTWVVPAAGGTALTK